MAINTDIRRRKSIRLQEYDYSSAGAYFVTICTHDRECLFGTVADEKIVLNDTGRIVESEWLKTAEIRANVSTDAYIIMPNHVHGILFIEEMANVGATGPVAPTKSGTLQPNTLGSIIGQFKSVVTKKIRQSGRINFKWQRGFYDRIIRNDELNRIREYIIYNPLKWHEDKDNPANWK
ncbi:transposase [candidate division KSB1 bacterium]|nr:transposase [candidate division KSB1 bacterium]